MLTRLATSILEGIARRLWGFAPNLMRDIVAQRGPLRALSWFLANMPRYERTLAAYGGIRTHLLATGVSLLNGCPYCSYGHALALELIYFRDEGRLFPLDEHELVALHTEDPAEIRRRLFDAVRQAGLDQELPYLERALELCEQRLRVEGPESAALSGATELSGADERRLRHLVDLFAVLNACGIRGATAPDQAHDPVNRDPALRAQYDDARRLTRRAYTASAART